MILITVAIMIAPASAYFGGQNVEVKAENMVDIAENALEAVMDLVETVETDTNTPTMKEMIETAGLVDDFYGNVSLCVEEGTLVNGITVTENGTGWEALNESKEALLVALAPEDYEEVIDKAQEALEVFRDVLKALKGILIDSGVEIEEVVDAQILQEAIERSQERVDTLVGLLNEESELITLLEQAQGNLTDAINALPDDVETAKEFLQKANDLISEVCQDLKTIAQELNPGRIRSYIARAFKNNERVQEKFRNRYGNQEDINQFLQGLGYENEEEFLGRFDDLIEEAGNAKTVKEAAKALQDLSKMTENTDNWLNQKMGNTGSNQVKGNGYGNMGGANSP